MRRAGEVATTIEVSHPSESLENSLIEFSWSVSKSLKREIVQSHSVASVPNNQQLTRYSPSENYTKTVGNRDSHCASHSLTSPLTWWKPGLFTILLKIGFPPNLLNIIRSFHDDMKGRVVFEGSFSDTLNIPSGVKQGCVLAHTLFGTLFTIMLKHVFRPPTKGIYLRKRSDGRLFNIARLKANTKIREECFCDSLFVDDAAVTPHSRDELQ